MMSTCPLVTGSKEPGQTTRYTRSTSLIVGPTFLRGETVPEGCFTVPARPLRPVAGWPVELPGPGGPLHHDQRFRGQPALLGQGGQQGADLRVGDGIGRVSEHDVVAAIGGGGDNAFHPVGG